MLDNGQRSNGVEEKGGELRKHEEVMKILLTSLTLFFLPNLPILPISQAPHPLHALN